MAVDRELFDFLAQQSATAASRTARSTSRWAPDEGVGILPRRRAGCPRRLSSPKHEARVGYEHVRARSRERTVRFDVPGVELDLGGIAQGLCRRSCDRAAAETAASTAALVSAGGSTVYALGAPPGAGRLAGQRPGSARPPDAWRSRSRCAIERCRWPAYRRSSSSAGAHGTRTSWTRAPAGPVRNVLAVAMRRRERHDRRRPRRCGVREGSDGQQDVSGALSRSRGLSVPARGSRVAHGAPRLPVIGQRTREAPSSDPSGDRPPRRWLSRGIENSVAPSATVNASRASVPRPDHLCVTAAVRPTDADAQALDLPAAVVEQVHANTGTRRRSRDRGRPRCRRCGRCARHRSAGGGSRSANSLGSAMSSREKPVGPTTTLTRYRRAGASSELEQQVPPHEQVQHLPHRLRSRRPPRRSRRAAGARRAGASPRRNDNMRPNSVTSGGSMLTAASAPYTKASAAASAAASGLTAYL